jgi:hypothetical protein
MNSDDDLRPFFGDFDLHGNEPAPPQQVEKLVSEVAKKLKIGPGKRAECEAAIRSQFRAAKASGEHGKKIPSPRKIKDTAGAISSSLRKAKIAMARIDEFYASLWPDVDPEQRYDDFGRLIEKAIKVADALDRGMIISDESRPRDINKYSSQDGREVSDFKVRRGRRSDRTKRYAVGERHRSNVLQGADRRTGRRSGWQDCGVSASTDQGSLRVYAPKLVFVKSLTFAATY